MPQSNLPNFLVIGAARAGTTSLYHALKEHPDIFMPAHKEPQFFTEHWERGLDYYAPIFEGAGDQARRGEASVSYSYRERPEITDRIRQTLGDDVDIIYVVRQPAERVFSHYLYYRHTGQKESREFDDAIRANPVYCEASRYGSWFKLYRDAFGEQRVHLVCFEDLKDDMTAVAQACYRFLGVDDSFVPAHQKKTNARFAPRNELLYRAWRKFSLSQTRRTIERLIPEGARPSLRNVVHKVLGTQRGLPTLGADARARLEDELRGEVETLSELSGRDYLERWNMRA